MLVVTLIGGKWETRVSRELRRVCKRARVSSELATISCLRHTDKTGSFYDCPPLLILLVHPA